MRKLIVLFSLIVWTQFAIACDFCNCYLGINPHYKKNTIGTRYTQSVYYGSHLDNQTLEKYSLSPHDFSETRSNIEVYAQYYPLQKLQMQVFVPYVVNVESMSDNAFHAFSTTSASGNRLSHVEPSSAAEGTEMKQSSTVQGFGDPLLLAQYQLFNLNAMDSVGIKQRLLAGAGVKFPLGKSKMDEAEDPLEKTHQPGTGSWDVMPSLSYLAKYKKWGMNVNASYMITSRDKYRFQFSNRLNANLNVYREFNKAKLFMYPSLGMYFEQAGKDLYKLYILENSGGAVLLAHAGLDVYYRKFSLSAAFHLPTSQQLNGAQPHMQYRIIAGLGYAFN
ncbi:MAG: transporter [Bacteroidetes bacterium]|nr:transporter [Bacteroidota bacterium]